METTQNDYSKLTISQWANIGYKKANEILAPMDLFERLEILKNTPSSMLPYEHWIRQSKKELMQRYMNAFVTMSCMGHWKGERNVQLCNTYLKKMKEHNVPVPKNKVIYILGVFNGEGSY